MRIHALGFIVAATLATAAQLSAQEQVPPRDTAKAALQARVRQRLAAVAKQRLELSDDQMRQLTAVNASYESRRRSLMTQEHEARVTVRGELQRGKQADQKRVDTALTELFRIQRARIDLAEQEQRDLAKFMQPSQRAGYLALQEQVRRRVDQMRKRRQ
jgi:hypothetical protein